MSQEQLKEITKKLNRDFFESESAVRVFYLLFFTYFLHLEMPCHQWGPFQEGGLPVEREVGEVSGGKL